MVFQNGTQMKYIGSFMEIVLSFCGKTDQIATQNISWCRSYTTKYIQYRINIPEKIIKEIGWKKENHITVSVESRNGKKTISLKIKD